MKKLTAYIAIIALLMFCACAFAEEAAEPAVRGIEALEASARAFEEETFSGIEDVRPFEGSVSIRADMTKEAVVLTADVTANGDYTLSWEVDSGEGWRATGEHGLTLTVGIREAAAGSSYRCVLEEA